MWTCVSWGGGGSQQSYLTRICSRGHSAGWKGGGGQGWGATNAGELVARANLLVTGAVSSCALSSVVQGAGGYCGF